MSNEEKDPISHLRPDDGVNQFCISLSKLTEKKIKDVHGYVSVEFGEPVYKLCYIVFEDGTEAHCEGEYDMPYIIPIKDTNPKLGDEYLQEIYDLEHADDEE